MMTVRRVRSHSVYICFIFYPVEGDSLVPVLAAVEKNVPCSFQELQDDPGFACSQSNILRYLAMTLTGAQTLILKSFNHMFSLV